MKSRLIVGISGASGAIYGVRLLQALQDLPVETHLVMSKAAEMTLADCPMTRALRLRISGDQNRSTNALVTSASACRAAQHPPHPAPRRRRRR